MRGDLKTGFFKDYVAKNWWFYILTLIGVGLIIASFLVPPMGVIDPSVLGAMGEIFAFAGLGTVIKAIDEGVDAKVEHNNTSVTIGDLNKSEDETEEAE